MDKQTTAAMLANSRLPTEYPALPLHGSSAVPLAELYAYRGEVFNSMVAHSSALTDYDASVSAINVAKAASTAAQASLLAAQSSLQAAESRRKSALDVVDLAYRRLREANVTYANILGPVVIDLQSSSGPSRSQSIRKGKGKGKGKDKGKGKERVETPEGESPSEAPSGSDNMDITN